MFDIRDARQYMERLLWIRTKEGDERKLVLKPAQQRLMEAIEEQERAGKPVRIIILKARQEGISTAISGWIFSRCATRENRAALLVAHKSDATANLYNMHKRFYDRLPAVLRPMRAASNATELLFANPSKNPDDRAREPGLRSRIRCATAGGDGVGRSDTLQYVHISEYAFWPDGVNTKADALLGILQAVPALPGTAVFIESTPNGFEDFHRIWADAVAGRNDFYPLFIPWSQEPGYRRPVDPGTVWSDEERELMERFGLEPEQLAWRRWCIANNCGGSLEKFHQEYPLTPEEAFIASGDCWFDTKILTRRLAEIEAERADVGIGPYGELAEIEEQATGTSANSAESPVGSRCESRTATPGATSHAFGQLRQQATGDEGVGVPFSARPQEWNGTPPPPAAVPLPCEQGRFKRGRFTYEKIWDASLRKTVISGIRFVERKDGPVTVWREPMERVPYVIGGDTAGDGSDWFSAYVVDNTDASMCARLYMRHDEAEYTAQVYCLGEWYNKALIGLEVNFSTYPTRSLQDWGYPRLYVRIAEDSYTHKPEERFGWRTDRITRPAMLAELRETVEAHPEILRDADLIREMLTFVKNKDGRPEAMEGEHDDLVMGYGITLRIRDQQSAVRAPEPGGRGRYTEDMLEDYYAASPRERAMMEQSWGKPF